MSTLQIILGLLFLVCVFFGELVFEIVAGLGSILARRLSGEDSSDPSASSRRPPDPEARRRERFFALALVAGVALFSALLVGAFLLASP